MMRTGAPWRASSQAIASPVVPAPTIKIGELLAIRADSPKAIVEKYTMLVHRENSNRRLPTAKGIPEFSRRAESLGYDYRGAGERMMFHGPISNSIIGYRRTSLCFSSGQIEALHSFFAPPSDQSEVLLRNRGVLLARET